MSDDDQAQGSQLEQMLPILLQNGHLTAEEQLAWFRTSNGLAELVLKHAACTHLELTASGVVATAAMIITDLCRCRSSRRSVRAQQLAAQSDNVTLTLHRGLITPAACLWQSITTIQLSGIQLNQTSIHQLQLHRLPRLQTLKFSDCGAAPDVNNPAVASHQCRSTSIRTLACLKCAYEILPSVALSLADASQLQMLITDQISSLSFLPQLPALQELHVGGDHGVYDQGLQQLLAHPRLLRLRVPYISLTLNHADTPCTWESLHLSGASVHMLARMPLAGVRSCIVHGSLYMHASATAAAEAVISSITGDRARCLVFQGITRKSTWAPAEPTFTVWCHAHQCRLSAQLIALALRHLAPGTALVLKHVEWASPEVVASLAAAPATLRTLCFYGFCSEWIGARAAVADGLLAHMPHVKHVVLGGYGQPSTAWWLHHVRLLVAGVSRPLRLILVMCKLFHPGWKVADREGICQWVNTHANEHVKVEYQYMVK